MKVAITSLIFHCQRGELYTLLQPDSRFLTSPLLTGYLDEGKSLREMVSSSIGHINIRNPHLLDVSTIGMSPSDTIHVVYYSATSEKNAPSYTKWYKVSDMVLKEGWIGDLFISAAAALRQSAKNTSLVFDFLPLEFSLGDMQRVFEALVTRKMDDRNFRKRFLELELVTMSSYKPKGMSHRPPNLFRFDFMKFEQLLLSNPDFSFYGTPKGAPRKIKETNKPTTSVVTSGRELRQPSERCVTAHNFIIEMQYGVYGNFGYGAMTYRRCLECGHIEYANFTDSNGKTTTISAGIGKVVDMRGKENGQMYCPICGDDLTNEERINRCCENCQSAKEETKCL